MKSFAMKLLPVAVSLVLFCYSIGAYGQIIEFTDVNFKHTLVNDIVVDNNLDGFAESMVDTNSDGEIQVSEAEAVLGLITVGQNIVSIDGIEHFVNLRSWFCSYNDIEVMNFPNQPDLEVLVCAFNELTSLDVSNNPNLRRLDADINHLQELDVSNNPLLERLWLSFNELTTMDVSSNINLLNFNIDSNFLTEIDLSSNTLLEVFAIDQNQISEIDLSNNLELFFVDVYGNQLEYLDLSLHTKLEKLTCLNNNLNYLNIQNGNNQEITLFNALNNPELDCIQVDDVGYASTREDWQVDDGIIFSENCLLGIDEEILAKVTLHPNPCTDTLFIDIAEEIHVQHAVLYNSLGDLLIYWDEVANSLDVSQLPTGVYFLKFYTSDGSAVVEKIVKA